jgi:glycosyltransferase involved in cell wall biosynthesis
MKIAYVCYWNMRRRDGVAEKISSQLHQWRAAGHDAELFFLSAEDRADDSALDGGGRPFLFSGGRGRIAATSRLAAAVRGYRADLIYLRYDLFSPTLLRAVAGATVVAELNSNVAAELQARSRGATLYERLQRRVLLPRLAGAVAVTHELERELRAARPSLATAVIANGVELAPERGRGTATEARPRLVYLGEGVYWQGIDKILELAAAFPDWSFDLVGVEGDDALPNVAYRGFLEAEAYAPILDDADIGLGTLALHRKQMDEACPLKVRRYLEFGLPVVVGYTDTDLVGLESWWLLRLPNTETNVRDNRERIAEFVASVHGRRVPRVEVEPIVSASAKEATRLAFFEQVLSGRPGPRFSRASRGRAT